MTSMRSSTDRFNVLIAGGGVAALEAALALHELAGDRISSTLISPNPEFVYRPMTAREPFAYSTAQRYSIEEIAQDIGIELVVDSFQSVDVTGRRAQTDP